MLTRKERKRARWWGVFVLFALGLGRRRTTHKGTSEGACTAAGCKADLTSTMSLSAPPLAPGAPPGRRRATHKGTSEGACIAAGCKADPTSTTPLSAPPLAPGAPPSGWAPLLATPIATPLQGGRPERSGLLFLKLLTGRARWGCSRCLRSAWAVGERMPYLRGAKTLMSDATKETAVW